jgi:hypothetical protein
VSAPKLPDWIGAGLKHPLAAAAAMTLGLRLGHEVYLFGADELDPDELKKRTGQHLGAVGGTLLGAAAGALVPGSARAISCFAGALIGEIVGEHFGRTSAQAFLSRRKKAQSAENQNK